MSDEVMMEDGTMAKPPCKRCLGRRPDGTWVCNYCDGTGQFKGFAYSQMAWQQAQSAPMSVAAAQAMRNQEHLRPDSMRIADLEGDKRDLLTMLRELEYVPSQWAGQPACPVCTHFGPTEKEPTGHAVDCRLAALLARFR